jgi:glycosyltransferase involved in cell wall biosynthesis
MKVSFVTTVLNEEKTIGDLLDSLLQQSQKPDEIIIVDAGSTDKTAIIISDYIKKSPIPIKLIGQKNLNRAQGRNLGIRQAKHELIAVSDAGCVLDKNWLKLITAPFKDKKVDAVAGFYRAKAKTILQRCIAPFVSVMPDRFDTASYLPSSRSLAFRKIAWKKAGRYPENLDYCEDLIFAQQLKEKTNLLVMPQAIVYWQMTNNLLAFFRQIQNYASGDVLAGYQPHLRKISLVFLRYVIMIISPPLFLIYLLWPLVKHFRYVLHPSALIYLPLLQIIADFGVMSGALKGAVKRLKSTVWDF